MTRLQTLDRLVPGTRLLVGGNRVFEVPEDLAARFRAGDSLAVVEASGEVLHLPAAETALAQAAVSRAHRAFEQMPGVSSERISLFYDAFARRVADDAIWNRIVQVNTEDVRRARERGRSVTRLIADDRLRSNVINGLRAFAAAPSQRGRVIETVAHEGWVAELVGAELGVVGFVFEGRPNVVADATGVLRGGNTVVFRIGSDALETARAMLTLALEPALAEASLPEGAVSLVDATSHAAGWALFSDRRLSLAVARGSGPAVATLGSLARQAGVPVSLHGKGGAWIVAAESASPEQLEEAVFRSLDRKVCNTLNTLCLTEAVVERQLGAALAGLSRAAERRGREFKLHVLEESARFVPDAYFREQVTVQRAEGAVLEPRCETLTEAELGREWEWEDSPELTLVVCPTVDHAVSLFNRYSPRFVASLLSRVPAEHETFYRSVDAPFVGDDFTRWVDGQFALNRPELGLSNWEHGRLFGRGGVLSGDGVFTVRTRYRTTGTGG